MNTIGRYGVHDKAVLRLSPRMLTFKNSFEGEARFLTIDDFFLPNKKLFQTIILLIK